MKGRFRRTAGPRGTQRGHVTSLPSQTPADPSKAQTSYSNAAAPRRNRSLVSQHALGSHAFQAPPGELSRKTRLPNHDVLREEVQKARRLLRFGSELSQPVVQVVEIYAESGQQQADIDFSEATGIVGLCPDMCPEPERAERERNGNLDKHEWLDGDRNQTSKFLAVKKYNRTAERYPDLIRPLPVLMKTMDYLLELMDRPYDDDFLGLYNFLWDRMRAVRMDLRMQHICNLEAISMLEQMIRLHIIAMHEFCEYKKKEGFSEGYDAHLNIEQMNKASVELFEMYEYHKRKGRAIPTEKEFRAYYALLKLDMRPGYKVKPADLSLDLAKMSSEVRQSPEISFAREVAKACRMGNYISFFRLAKKATFLQACLMHAHFSKLRTEALGSLHSSFTSNNGMPLSRLEEMLAMEGEDIESFVVCHGLVLKRFDEMYLVRAGAYLREGDPTSKRSPLVDSKRSDKIKSDVCFPPEGKHLSAATPKRRVDAISLPPPPVCTGHVPVMEASDTLLIVLSKLSALSLAPSSVLACGDQKNTSTSGGEVVQVMKFENTELLGENPKPTILALPDVHVKVLEEARADEKIPYNTAQEAKRRKTCEKTELLKEAPKPTIAAVPDGHAKVPEEARADDEIPDNVAPAVKKRKCEKMEFYVEKLEPTIPDVPDVHADALEEARADDEIPDSAALLVKRRKTCEKMEDKVKKCMEFDKDDRFNCLLDRCRQIQNEIDKLLYFYF